MNKKYLFASAFLLSLAGLGVFVLAFASIDYPVKELGNCANEQSCKTYCDKSSHAEACLDFAEKNNLMSADEIGAARKFLDAGSGPGGCDTKDSCETYCDSVSHIDECVSFAEKNGLMPADQLEEAKKVQAAMARGVKPPACGGKKQCDVYCFASEHMEECIIFAQEAGFMKPQELEDSKKVRTAIKAGVKPPPCQGKDACDVYCSQEDHFDACFAFASAAGFIDPKEAEMMKKTKGAGPGGCRGKEACDTFCQTDGNMEICAQFAYDNGMMTKDEFEMMKKTGGKGPGGCKSKEECQSFCDDPNNQETCMSFAKEHDMMPAEDMKRMEEGKQQFQNALQNMPPEVYSCLESAVGAEVMAKFKSGGAMPPREIGDKMQECFGKNMPQRPENAGPMNGGGPGSFVPGDRREGGSPGVAGPGGCTSPEECRSYCESNPEQCKNFIPQNQPVQGIMPARCDGENCPPPPSQSDRGPAPFMPPCEGGNCSPQQFIPPGVQIPQESFGRPPEGDRFMPPQEQMDIPPPGMPGSYIPPAGMNPPAGQQPFVPPPTDFGTGSGGNMPPGDFVPPAPPSGETMPPSASPPPSEQPTSFLDNSFLGSVLSAFSKLLFR